MRGEGGCRGGGGCGEHERSYGGRDKLVKKTSAKEAIAGKFYLSCTTDGIICRGIIDGKSKALYVLIWQKAAENRLLPSVAFISGKTLYRWCDR